MNYNNQFQNQNFPNNFFNNFCNLNSNDTPGNYQNNQNFTNVNNYQPPVNQINNLQNQGNIIPNAGIFNTEMVNQNYPQNQNFQQNNPMNQNFQYQNFPPNNCQQQNLNQFNNMNQNYFQPYVPQNNFVNNNYPQQNFPPGNNYAQPDYSTKPDPINANNQFPLPLDNNALQNFFPPSEQQYIQNIVNDPNYHNQKSPNLIKQLSKHPQLYEKSKNRTAELNIYSNHPTSPFDQMNIKNPNINMPYNQINENPINYNINPSSNINNQVFNYPHHIKGEDPNINPNQKIVNEKLGNEDVKNMNNLQLGGMKDLNKQNLIYDPSKINKNQLIPNNDNLLHNKIEMRGISNNQNIPNIDSPENIDCDNRNHNSNERKKFKRVGTFEPPQNDLIKNQVGAFDISTITKYTKGNFIEVKRDDINLHYKLKEILGKGSFGEVW